MENEDKNTLSNGSIQRIFYSLSTYPAVALWNKFIEDAWHEHGDEVFDLKIYLNNDESLEEQFEEPIVLVRWVLRSKDYNSEHAFVVFNDTFGKMESFNDPCIFVQDHADYCGFWEWFEKKVIASLYESIKEA